MSDRNRGAAHVSVMWVIALGVLLLAVLLFGFLTMQKNEQLQEDLNTANSNETAAEAALQARNVEVADIFQVVGFRGQGGGGDTDASQVTARLAELGNTFPSVPETVSTFEATVPGLVADYNALLNENNTLKGERQQLQDNLTARMGEIRTLTSDKDATIAELQRKYDDTIATKDTQIADVERQRDAARDERRDLDRQLTEARARFDGERRTLQDEVRQVTDRTRILGDRLNAVERAAETADGSILAASPDLGRAWIDIGRRDRVYPGLEFEVRSSTNQAYKGRVKVRSVEERRSEVNILEMRDRYDPIGEDDVILNAVFDPTRTPIAVLLGNGFGKYSQNDMGNKLTEVGLEVREEMTNEVDYLILGTPFFDPDTGDPIPFSTMDLYKAAESAGAVIVPLRDVFFWLGI